MAGGQGCAPGAGGVPPSAAALPAVSVGAGGPQGRALSDALSACAEGTGKRKLLSLRRERVTPGQGRSVPRGFAALRTPGVAAGQVLCPRPGSVTKPSPAGAAGARRGSEGMGFVCGGGWKLRVGAVCPQGWPAGARSGACGRS